MTAITITKSVTLEIREAGCGHFIALPSKRWKELEETGERMYCPYGEIRLYTKSENERLRQELIQAQEFANNARQREQSALAMLIIAQKETKRLTRRAKNGVCAICHRAFSQVSRHMKTKHPEVQP